MELDLGAVRAFLAVVDEGHFTEAAVSLGMTQQAVSKRIARLETELGAALLDRSRTGARPTEDGAAFLPHARALIGLADQATAMARARRRALRIDVLGRDNASIDMTRDFYEAGDVDVDIVVSRGRGSRWAELGDGAVDAAFGRVTAPLPDGFARIPAFLQPLAILVSRRHALARRTNVPLAELAEHPAWMPANARDSEWARYYRYLTEEFGVRIDSSGPVFGREYIMERVAAEPGIFTFGDRRHYPPHPDIVEVAIVDPTPVYPWSLLWHEANRHPSLRRFVTHVGTYYRAFDPGSQWIPSPDRELFPTVNPSSAES
jgi:DNA-binding transcriptional LysR family regulator